MKEILTVLLCCWTAIAAGQYAGNDTTICTPGFVTLGIDNPDPDHCYTWYAQNNGSRHIFSTEQNPGVFIEETREFSLVVTDQDFSFATHDDVTITLALGELKVLGAPIAPDILGSDEPQAFAGVVGSPSSDFEWSIEADPDDTGCDIDGDGTISKCTDPGTITIRATSLEDPECYTEAEVPVNQGIEDLVVREASNTARNVRKDGTLYVVGSTTLRFTAIPNPGYTLPSDQPEWAGDLLPEEEHALEWETEVLEPGEYVVVCSDLDVTVVVLPDNEEESFVPTASNLWTRFDNALNGLSFSPHYCSSSPELEISMNNELQAVVKNREYDSSPEYYKEIVVRQDAVHNIDPVTGSGCAFLSDYQQFHDIPGIGEFELIPYLLMDNASSDNINDQVFITTTEESPEAFEEIEMQFYPGVEVRAGILSVNNEAGISMSSQASAQISSVVNGNLRLNGKKIEYMATANGLQLRPKGYVYTGTPSNPLWQMPVNMSINIMDGAQTQWALFADLSHLFED